MKKYLLFFLACTLATPAITFSAYRDTVVRKRRIVRRERDRGRSTGKGLFFGGLTGATIGGLAGGGRGAGIGAGVGALTGGLIGSTRRPKYEEEIIEEYPVDDDEDDYYVRPTKKRTRSYLTPGVYKTDEYYEPDYKASRYTRPYRGQMYHPTEDDE